MSTPVSRTAIDDFGPALCSDPTRLGRRSRRDRAVWRMAYSGSFGDEVEADGVVRLGPLDACRFQVGRGLRQARWPGRRATSASPSSGISRKHSRAARARRVAMAPGASLTSSWSATCGRVPARRPTCRRYRRGVGGRDQRAGTRGHSSKHRTRALARIDADILSSLSGYGIVRGPTPLASRPSASARSSPFLHQIGRQAARLQVGKRRRPVRRGAERARRPTGPPTPCTPRARRPRSTVTQRLSVEGVMTISVVCRASVAPSVASASAMGSRPSRLDHRQDFRADASVGARRGRAEPPRASSA